MKRTVAGMVMLFCLALPLNSARAENFAPPKVIAAMKNYDSHLKIIAVHRGHSYQGCPENSVCSVAETSKQNIEAVEIDVRHSANGTLWPIHDTNIGRMTNFSTNGNMFDPHRQAANDDTNNPLIAQTTDATLARLKLRDPLGHVTAYPFRPLEAMMQDVDMHNRHLVYIFDIKGQVEIRKTAEMILRLKIQDRSILKFNSNLVPPGRILDHTLGVNFVPVIGTGSLDAIADHFHLEKRTPAERVNSYVLDLARTKGFVYFEVRNKMYSGGCCNPANVRVNGPLEQVDLFLVAANISRGGYSPSPEYLAKYYSVTGHCCESLTGKFDHSRYFGNDTRDDRENIFNVVAYNAVTIAERGAAALQEARNMGARRDLHKILY